ncbi:Hypothetical protein NTJ_02498 [Nesidiocoris tenuis]|uniref:Uncharacterized protein n=1 Tax=Nesidiocoris tenuis TaxID=355587 RepID=A0ABN7ABQ6_9HEMI|nr:Hypothetical protein NTJ_02498 [Nesidiocoris tenuis]
MPRKRGIRKSFPENIPYPLHVYQLPSGVLLEISYSLDSLSTEFPGLAKRGKTSQHEGGGKPARGKRKIECRVEGRTVIYMDDIQLKLPLILLEGDKGKAALAAVPIRLGPTYVGSFCSGMPW